MTFDSAPCHLLWATCPTSVRKFVSKGGSEPKFLESQSTSKIFSMHQDSSPLGKCLKITSTHSIHSIAKAKEVFFRSIFMSLRDKTCLCPVIHGGVMPSDKLTRLNPLLLPSQEPLKAPCNAHLLWCQKCLIFVFTHCYIGVLFVPHRGLWCQWE